IAYQRLEEAQKTSGSVLICFHDRTRAILGLFTKQGFLQLQEQELSTEKKTSFDQVQSTKDTIVESISHYMKSYQPQLLIIAAPDFFRTRVLQLLPEELKKRAKFIPISDVSLTSMDELLQQPAFHQLQEVKYITQQQEILQQVLQEISHDGKATYGFEQVQEAANLGAVDTCLVSHAFLLESKEKDQFDEIKDVLSLIEKQGGTVHIVDEENPLHKTLYGITGICALLRFVL
ncbi:MAG: hypothetical protein ACMXYA_01775, partial [Candidatus Woesearchaeota archaeon]